jgi:hypothetical protein
MAARVCAGRIRHGDVRVGGSTLTVSAVVPPAPKGQIGEPVQELRHLQAWEAD